MRRLLCPALLVVTACGGNWSNADLEFSAALPWRRELGSTLPTSASTGQPLSRQDGLNAGEPSQAYVDTKKAVTDFNGLLDFFLGVIDTVRAQPPSSRADEARTWGPFVAADLPGYQFQVTITRTASEPRETFAWSIQARRFGEADFFDLVRGDFQASPETVRRGVGTIEVPVKEVRARATLPAELQQLDRVSIGYQTSTFPQTTQMGFTFAAGNPIGLSQGGYRSERREDGAGALVFSLSSLDPNLRRATVRSRWLVDGSGAAVLTVDEGTYRGATRSECWNAQYKVTWFKESWPGGKESGRQADCPAGN
ncbi:MAG: hypothetical protein INH41_29525 [Myxococcaceae bacterium]|nr:hypothetical protein [Myxococcaceae bacterium]